MLASRPLSGRSSAMAMVIAWPILLGAAIWNRFPIVFYDTGAYLLQGLGGDFIMERSSAYSLFLKFAGAGWSLWAVAAVQAILTAFVMVEFARVERPDLSLPGFLSVVTAMALATSLPWYVGQIEPDFATALLTLSLYLLTFRADRIGYTRRAGLVAVGALTTALHPSHLGLALILVSCTSLMGVFNRKQDSLRPKFELQWASVAFGFALVVGANYALTRDAFVSRAGFVFLSARLTQDGMVKRVLDQECLRAKFRMCEFKDELPASADAWLWDSESPFNTQLGGFRGMRGEAERIAVESLARYPLANLEAATADTALQLILVQTGDGIGPQKTVLDPEFRKVIPKELSGYAGARQQRGELSFVLLNVVHVSVAYLSIVAMSAWLWRSSVKKRHWSDSALPAFVLAALLINAAICAVFSGPHGRYQSRVAWLPAFALLIAGAPPSARSLADQGRIRHLIGSNGR
jgi:hypothetical protein